MARTIPISFALLVLVVMLVAALPVEASVAGTEVFLPAVGTGPGVPPSYWYTTVWVFNPNDGPAEVEFNFLRKNQSNNPSDISETIMVEPGEVAGALVHRLLRALSFDDMRRLSAQRAEKLGLSGAQLRMVSMIDVVTGLFNRRYFRKHLRESFAGARRYQRPLTLLLLRIESFRELLNAWGTEGTNDVLDSVALAITTVIREADIAARLDEDVFGFLLPETTEEGASSLVQRLMARFKTARFPHNSDIEMVYAYAQLEADHNDGSDLLDATLLKLPPRKGVTSETDED